MLPTSAGVEPATSWSPVGRRIQLSHRGRLKKKVELAMVNETSVFQLLRFDCILLQMDTRKDLE